MTGSPKRGEDNPRVATNGLSFQRQNRGGPTLDRVIQAQIGDKLRAMYGELVEQPVPDRLSAILAQLGGSRRDGNS